ncbi:MAG: beta strand repeat-containing protein [Legionellales bacterium]
MTNSNNLITLSVTSVNGVANAYSGVFNAQRIVSVSQVGTGALIQYDTNNGSAYTYFLVSNSFSSIVPLIGQPVSGTKISIPVTATNGTTIPSQNFLINVAKIIFVESDTVNGSLTNIIYALNNGTNYTYQTSLSVSQVIALSNTNNGVNTYSVTVKDVGSNVSTTSAPSTLDGVTLAAGNRILLTSQSSGVNNGIYVFTAASSPMLRSSDFGVGSDVNSGDLVVVEEGTANISTVWELATPNPIVVGTTSLTFVRVGSQTGITGTGTATDLAYFTSAGVIASLNAAYNSGTNTLQVNTHFNLTDATDNTKIAAFVLSGITTMTTRTITVPDASGTMTLLGNAATGTGSVVLATSPVLTTPNIGAATATTINGMTLTASTGTFTLVNAKVFTVNNTMTLAAGADSQTFTFPSVSGTIATLNANQKFTGNVSYGGQLLKTQTPFTAGTDTTAGWTLANVTAGLVAGIIKSTTAAGVTITLDSVANIITAFAAAGVTLTTGSEIQFILDNSQGSNTLTLAVDGGTTITAAKQTSSGDTGSAVLLTVAASAGASVGRFALYLTSATTGTLFRIG